MRSIIPTTAMNELSRIRKNVDHLRRHLSGDDGPWKAMPDWMPTLDVSQTDGEINVRAELPGLDADDIDIGISGDRLTLSGMKKDERRDIDSDTIHHESYFGAFQRTVQLPSKVAADAATARFKNGVLTVTLPATERRERQTIAVESG